MIEMTNENESRELLEQVVKNQAEIEAAVLDVIEGCELYIDHLEKKAPWHSAEKYVAALDVLEKYEMITRA